MKELTLNFNDEELEFFEKYANEKGLTVSEFVRQTVLNRIADEHDLQCYENAKEKFMFNPKLYSLGDIEKELMLF